MKVIKSKWIFTRKEPPVKTFKARLVARGFDQEENEYREVYAPVTSVITIRIFLLEAIRRNEAYFAQNIGSCVSPSYCFRIE